MNLPGIDSPGFPEGWYVCDLMGHQRWAGYVREIEAGGGKMFRIDVPGEKPDEWLATTLFTSAAVHHMTCCTEAVARAEARLARPVPARALEYRDSWHADPEDDDDCIDLDDEDDGDEEDSF